MSGKKEERVNYLPRGERMERVDNSGYYFFERIEFVDYLRAERVD